jgi:DNA-binding CsgD family transcriptional regulator
VAGSRHERLLELAWSLASTRGHEELVSAALTSLRDLGGADSVGFIEPVPLSDGQPDLLVRTFPYPETADDIRARIGRTADDARCFAPWERNPRPFRMTDVVSQEEFRHTLTYAEIFEPCNLEYQIQMRLELCPEGGPTGMYCLMRSGDDFTDEELVFAHSVQATLHAIHAAASVDDESPTRRDAVSAVRLTPREQDIFTLMASGMTAAAIGHARRISRRTVCKHLENIYVKLDAHDRITAINRARHYGLLRQ